MTDTKDTFFSRAQIDADLEVQGRFKKVTETRVTGVPQYPQQPASSPFAGDPVPPEPPLGIDVNAIEAVGTPVEVEKSIVGGMATSPWAMPNLEDPGSADDGHSPPTSSSSTPGSSFSSTQDEAVPLSSTELASAVSSRGPSASSTPTRRRRG